MPKSRFGDKLLAKVQSRQPVQHEPTPAAPVVSHNAGNVFNCFVPGDPESQGGTVPLRNKHTNQMVQVTKGSKGLAQWRKHMTKCFVYARQQTDHQTVDGPCKLQATFFMPRLSGHPKTIQGRFWADTALDLDKMIRALKDSLTKAGVYVNDSRVCAIISYKRYAGLMDTPGVHVVITPLPVSSAGENLHIQSEPPGGAP